MPLEGVGLGLRAPHHRLVLDESPAVAWFEILIDNHLAEGGPLRGVLERVAERYPLAFHSTSLSLGASDPIDRAHLARVRRLIDRHAPAVVSDHLCWSHAGGVHGHDLLPLPFTREAVHHVAERIRATQDLLGRRIAIENVSAYVRFADDAMPEEAFLAEVVEAADCDILLDVNNVYVNARNFGTDARAYLDAVPAERVVQYHLSGHADLGTHVVDTHGSAVVPAVWELYEHAVRTIGTRPTCIEWDNEIPAFDALVAERERAEAVVREVAT